MIAKGHFLLEQALPMGQLGVYQLQAAIHGLHCDAQSADQTDWSQIIGLYAILMRVEPSVIVTLNHAVAMSFAGQATAALVMLEDIEDDLKDYQPFHAAIADVFVRLGYNKRADIAYDRAIDLSKVEAERQYLITQKKRPSNARP
jgi:RNA polymerase sigma-70 factor (ECF subfamily)